MALTVMKLCKMDLRMACGYHTTSSYQAKAANAFRKVLGLSSKKKRIYGETPILPSATAFSHGSQEGRYSGNSRRATVLNKLFMRHITDLMATGENSSEFVGHGIEINRVQITPDFNGLNVFWVAKGNENDEIIETVLQKNTGFLRHELSTLRVMGVVPKITFVKDKKFAQVMEVDIRLAKADFGEDYVPVETEVKLKTQLEIFTPLPPEIKVKIKRLDGETIEEDLDEYEEPLPPMPQDVLGLNHEEILKRITKSMIKSEAVHRLNQDTISQYSSNTVNENPILYSRQAFKEFLEKRELMRSKARKLDKNYIPDVEYIKEEIQQRNIDYFKNMDIYDYADENDYIEEEETRGKI